MWRIGLASGIALAAIGGCGEKAVLAAEGPDRKDVQLTIYKEDFAMVSEVRRLALVQGKNSLAIKDVSAALDPRSVLFNWQNSGDAPALVSNSYDVGVANGAGLVKRYLGKPVELIRYSDTGRQSDSQQGVLMAADENGYVLQTEDNFYINPPGTIVANAEKGIVTIPRLNIVAESARQREEDLAGAYLTRGLSWSADYVGIVSSKEDAMALQCWATVENKSGVDYPDAKIMLVAGSPSRLVPHRWKSEAGYGNGAVLNDFDESGADVVASRMTTAAPMPMGDLQSYEVKQRSSIAQQQLNRLLMLESANVSATKDYSVRLPDIGAYEYYWDTRTGRPTVTASFTFFNTKKNGIGDALPAGAMRLYEKSKDGSLHYIGGASIGDTPEDEKINFTLSNVFDVVATNRIVSKKKVGKVWTKTAEVVLRNKKDAPIEVRVVQPISGTWKIVSGEAATKLDARTIQWKPSIPANGEVKLRYTLTVRQ